MFFKNKKNKKTELDVSNINETISILKTILKIVSILVFILGIYILTILFKELHIKENVITVLKIISPLFIGFFVAWLFDPMVSYLQKRGIRRTIGTTLTYVIFLSIIGLIIGSLIPLLGDQINEFVKMIPNVFNEIKEWINNIFSKLNNIDYIDMVTVKENIFTRLETFGKELTLSLPELAITILKALFSGIGNFVVGLIIGFFLLINFNNVSDSFITLFPKKMQNDTRDIFNEINTSFRRFINGAIADSTLIFVVSSICFFIGGLKAPLLFGLFCGITNIIPYAGPYIGGAPAVIVAFSQGIPTGIFVLI